MLEANADLDDESIFNVVTKFSTEVVGVNPPDYDTRELSKTEVNSDLAMR